MSMRQNCTAGQDYLKKRIMDRACAANVQIDDLSWYEPSNQDVSELTVTNRGKKKTYVINNIELEDGQRRSYLDQLAELIIKDFS